MRTRSVLKNAAVAAVATLLSLGAAEMAVRWIYRDVTTTADNASVFARRWNARQITNAWRFREREIRRTKPDGVFRIAVIGDSFTFGQGIPLDDRFSNRLQAALDAEGGPGAFEVLNFGRPGADTGDEVRILRDTVLPLEPDFVLLQWYVNDGELRDHSGRPSALPLLPSVRLRRILNRHSALYYMAQNGWASVQMRLGLVGSYEDYLLGRFKDPRGPDATAADTALHEFLSVCRENGVPVGIVLFPHLVSGPTYPFTELHRRVLDRCSADRVPCLDLTGTIWRGERTDTMWVGPLDRHPGSEANRIAAEEIFGKFIGIWNRTDTPS